MAIFRIGKPNPSIRALLFLAGTAWLVAGVLLLTRGWLIAAGGSFSFNTRIFFSLVAGGLFYTLLFSKISLNHIIRIISMENSNPGLFSFFSLKSYLIMIIMILSGVLLRKSGIILPEYLSLVYITMGLPLLISSFRFCYHGLIFKSGY